MKMKNELNLNVQMKNLHNNNDDDDKKKNLGINQR